MHGLRSDGTLGPLSDDEVRALHEDPIFLLRQYHDPRPWVSPIPCSHWHKVAELRRKLTYLEAMNNRLYFRVRGKVESAKRELSL